MNEYLLCPSAQIRERFTAKVTEHGKCWLWTACRSSEGYGEFVLGGRNLQAHRLAYEWTFGQIPDDHVVDHICRNRACVRPEHLQAVTERENLLRGVGMPAINARKRVCKRGHPFDRVVAKANGHTQRLCSICKAAATKRSDKEHAKYRKRAARLRARCTKDAPVATDATAS